MHKPIHHILLGLVLFLLHFLEGYFIGGVDMLLKNFSGRALPYVGTFYLNSIIVYFINFRVICPYFLPKKRFYSFGIAVSLLFPLFVGIRFLTEEVLLFNITGLHNYSFEDTTFGYYIFDNIYFAFKPILLSTVLFLIYRFIESEKNVHLLQIEHKKAEVDFLRSQISPHFLFNTLNTFYSELIISNPEMAKSIHRLSELLRYVTYESGRGNVRLTDEIQFINDYIYFYKLRFEDSLHVNFEIIGVAKNKKIPPLILIHFIENVFKHGIVSEHQKPASIILIISEHTLELLTENVVLKTDGKEYKGFGTKNIEQRLEAIYSDNFSLKTDFKNEWFKVNLKIPI